MSQERQKTTIVESATQAILVTLFPLTATERRAVQDALVDASLPCSHPETDITIQRRRDGDTKTEVCIQCNMGRSYLKGEPGDWR